MCEIELTPTAFFPFLLYVSGKMDILQYLFKVKLTFFDVCMCAYQLVHTISLRIENLKIEN